MVSMVTWGKAGFIKEWTQAALLCIISRLKRGLWGHCRHQRPPTLSSECETCWGARDPGLHEPPWGAAARRPRGETPARTSAGPLVPGH